MDDFSLSFSSFLNATNIAIDADPYVVFYMSEQYLFFIFLTEIF